MKGPTLGETIERDCAGGHRIIRWHRPVSLYYTDDGELQR